MLKAIVPSVDPDPWVDVVRAAQYLCVTEGALRQMVARRQVPFAKVGKRIRFRLSELDASMQRFQSLA